MNFLEARRVLDRFTGGDPLAFVFALSGTAEPFALYLRAAAAKRGRAAQVTVLPFNTLAQALRRPADPGAIEVFLLVPWDFVPEADWRSGVPESVDEEQLQARAAETARLLARRTAARLLYLPAALPPLFPDPARGAALARSIESLAVGLGARLLPAEAFALAGYFASGCPVGGGWIGRIAEAVVEAAAQPPIAPKKVLVTDLDNVLWNGVIGDDGVDGIAFEPSGAGYRHFVYQSLLRRLQREGTLLAAVTRNDAEAALGPFDSGRMPLHADDFVSIIAGYHAKSAQIRELAQRLNLGLDSFVFVDDNPVELAEVSLVLPDVRCLAFPQHDDELPVFLRDLASLFAHSDVTAEDRERTEMYRRRLEGMAPSDEQGADLTRFLQDLHMTLTIHDRSRGDRTRAVQLINKTNQFNLNGRRRTEQEVRAILEGGGRLFGASLTDRTGNHGEVLACLVAADATIASLVMSCRVFQRRLEYAFLAWLATQPHPPVGFDWASTPRNAPFRQFLGEIAGPLNGDGLVRIDPAALAGRYAGDLGLFAIADVTDPR
ncbi:MAG TPA: HAD-IIIC family phosphatase [Gemmatimonadales bacterium]|nr:HAD-IIIC family phosphatase [Gemmatimonadales bacterium]